MNKTKIEWCDNTWNPVTGCLHGCNHCYAFSLTQRLGSKTTPDPESLFNALYRSDGLIELSEPIRGDKGKVLSFATGFTPTFHSYRLGEPAKVDERKTVFVTSMGDLFGKWIPDDWIEAVFDACRKSPQHRYMFLTQNPKRYAELLVKGKLLAGRNVWYGATVMDDKSLKRAEDLYMLSPHDFNTFMSVEPLFGEVNFGLMPDWVIIGAETGKNPGREKVKPESAWISKIIDACFNASVSVFMKNNILPHWEEMPIVQFPWE